MRTSPQTSPSSRQGHSPIGDCPDDATLQAYLDQALPEDRTDGITRHLESCTACQAAAEACLNSDSLSQQLFWFQEVGVDFGSSPPVARSVDVPMTDPGLAADTDVSHTGVPSDPERVLADRFELRRTVGMGGCGTVYEAWDRQLRRIVAVKVPHWTLFEKPSVRQRFAKEARAAARLSHPNIVPVFEACVGETGECYLVSEFVSGSSLEEWIARESGMGRRINVLQSARIVAEIASGVDAAHAAGVIHRDLKPSNVLLAPLDYGDLPFIPRVTDFGLARLSEEVTATTADGVFGSVQYMSPEQAVSARNLSPSSDVYSLGVILYEMLTGSLPITAGSVPGLLAALPIQPVEPPRRQRPEIPPDLEAVCLKCLEKQPKDRYRTAGELAVDLRRILVGEPVTARLPNRREQFQRWARRNPTTAAVMATTCLAVLVVLGILADANRRQSHYITQLEVVETGLKSTNDLLTTANSRLQTAIVDAGQARQQAVARRRQLQENLYVSEFRQAMQAWESLDLPTMERILDALDHPDFAPYRGVECDWLRTKIYSPHRELTKFPRAVYTLAFAADGQLLAASGRDAIIKLVRFADSSPVAEWESGQKEVNGLAFVDEDKKLWTSGDDGSLVQWDVMTGRKLLRLEAHAPEQAHDLLVIPHFNLLLSTGTDGRVRLWDPLTGESIGDLPGDGTPVVAMDFHPDGRHLYVAYKNRICRWSVLERQITSEWMAPERVLTMRLTSDGRRVLCSLVNDRIQIFDSATWSLQATAFPPDHVRQLLRMPSSDIVYGIDDRGTWLQLHIPEGAKLADRWQFSPRPFARYFGGRSHFVQLSPDSKHVVATAEDGTVYTWPIPSLSREIAKETLVGTSHDVRLSPDDRAAYYSDGVRLHAVNLDSLETTHLRETKSLSCQSFCFMPDGDLLTAEWRLGPESVIVRRRSTDGEPLAEILLNAKGFVGKIDFDPKLRVALARHDQASGPALEMVSVDPPVQLRAWRFKSMPFYEYSAAGGRLVRCVSHSLEAYDAASRDVIWRTVLETKPDVIAVSPDGRLVACASQNRTIQVLRADSGTLVSEMNGHRRPIRALAFSNDGRTLFSGDEGALEPSEIRGWRVATGDFLGVIDTVPPSSRIRSLLVSRTDSRIVVHHFDRLKVVPLKTSAVR